MRKRKAKQGEKLFIMKVTLSDDLGRVRGYPSRKIAVLDKFSLYQLADEIIKSFNFDFDHPFGFYDNIRNPYRSDERYELFSDIGESGGCPGVKKTKIENVFNEKHKKMLFLFDYGDEWRFVVKYLGEEEPKYDCTYPIIIESIGDSPMQYEY